MVNKKNKAFFLDRDGVIVKDIGYLKDEKELIFFKDIFKILKYIKKKKLFNNYYHKSISCWQENYYIKKT